MTRRAASIPASYFEALYRGDADPWRFATSEYERGKYAATLAALEDERAASALEVGCSIGVLTASLAGLCDALLGIDVAEAALAQARTRCAAMPWVRFRRMRVPAEWPDGAFDLIVFSEVLYYLVSGDIAETARKAVASLRPGGRVVLVHWTGETDYPCTGDEAVAAFAHATAKALHPLRTERGDAYRIDTFRAQRDRG